MKYRWNGSDKIGDTLIVFSWLWINPAVGGRNTVWHLVVLIRSVVG
jgi:hypothetical protein